MHEPKFKVGDKVYHKVFGYGEITSNNGDVYTVEFTYSVQATCKDYELSKEFINISTDKFIGFVCNKLDKVKELFCRKNQQYSVGADSLANFRTGALLRAGNDSYAEMYEEAKDYQRKHVVHIERNGIDADKGDESLDDIIVYSAIMAYMRYCHEQEQNHD